MLQNFLDSRQISIQMELFKGAKAVRLRSHHDKYLIADDDEEHVRQDRSGADRAARWSVEFVDAAAPVLRLKSCYGRYLTASGESFLLGATGHKVLQTLPARVDSSVEWEPVRDGFQVKLKTRYGHFLRANGFLPPWRNSVTHDIPRRSATQDWILWDVDVLDLNSPEISKELDVVSASASASPKLMSKKFTSSSSFFSSSSSSSLPGSPQRAAEGRRICYKLLDDDDDKDEDDELWFTFKGTSVEELRERLEAETRMGGIFVCSRNPLDGELYPLRLHLPPNNAAMRVVVVPEGSRAARKFGPVETQVR